MDIDCLSPMFFGVSCAFFALRLLPEREVCENDVRWLEIRNRMLKGSAHLLGLLISRVRGGEPDTIIREDDDGELRRNLAKLQKEVEELKKRRSEEARANERVMSIVASREQIWFDERRQLKQQLVSLVKELRSVEAIAQSKDRAIEEGDQRLMRAETAVDELRENARLEGDRHSAEMGRALRQVELVVKQKEQSALMVRRLSMDLVKMRRDLEQKDLVLSGLIRRAGVEKKMFLKEIKRKLRFPHRHRYPNVPSDEFSSDGDDGDDSREVDALVEQLRLKDKNLEALRWRLLSVELESKRLQSHIEQLDCAVVQLRQENSKLDALLINREAELHSLKKQLVFISSSPEADGKVVKKRAPQKSKIAEDVVLGASGPSDLRQSDDGETDIHALGVSCKIKRLKQQFLMVERMAGKQENSENDDNTKGGFYVLTSLLNKQVERYQSLQAKTDDICRRMHDNNLDLNRRGSGSLTRTNDEMKRLEHFLEESFELQRSVVATGQKLMEVQAQMGSGFMSNAGEVVEQFADNVQMLFSQVQHGMEVRLSRIIGEVEGTLACDGINRLRK